MDLVPLIDRDGARYLSDAELSRVEDLTRRSVSADAVREAGDPRDELSIPEATRLLGASPSHLARLCRSYLTHQDEITDRQLLDDGVAQRLGRHVSSYEQTRRVGPSVSVLRT